MVVGAAIPGADEVKLVCSLHEVVISDEVMISYVTFILVMCISTDIYSRSATNLPLERCSVLMKYNALVIS